MSLLSSVVAMLGSFAGLASAATEAATLGKPADLLIWPVFLAILVALLAVTLLFNRHAIGSTPIPANVPVLPGGLPLIGAAIPALSNYDRCGRVLCCPCCLAGKTQCCATGAALQTP